MKYICPTLQTHSLELEGTVLMGSVSLKTIRRFTERSKRWTMAYINGLTGAKDICREGIYVRIRCG